jgi:protein-S-isoprenylcysteine O-methyltransferase Ste14
MRFSEIVKHFLYGRVLSWEGLKVETRVKRINYLPVFLDAVERLTLAVLLGLFAFNILGAWLKTGGTYNLLLFVSEGIIIVFTIVRRYTKDISQRPLDWLFALLGTVAPLLVLPSEDAAIAPAAVFLTMMALGLLLQVSAKLTLRRSFGVVAANRGVKSAGPYRLVRHPMYAGYVLTQLGFLLANPTAWNVGIYLFAWAFQYVRIVAEERLLSQDAAYREFAKAVPYRVFPGLL